MGTFGFIFGVLGFIFGISALARIPKLVKRIETLEASHNVQG